MRDVKHFLLLAALAALAGCATTRADADRKVERAQDRSARSFVIAKQGYLRDHGLTRIVVETRVDDSYGRPPQPDVPAPVALPVPADHGFSGETLIQLDADTIGLVTPVTQCSCDCEPSATYDVGQDKAGRIVVLRLAAREHVETVTLSGNCGEGCGTPMPPIPGSILVLPVSDPTLVSIVDVTYDEYTVNVTCDHPTPVP